MFPLIFRVLRNYAPYITLPAAAIVGIIGYNLENLLSDKYTPYQDSVSKLRSERMASESTIQLDSLKDKKFVPASVFEKNLSPSLQDK